MLTWAGVIILITLSSLAGLFLSLKAVVIITVIIVVAEIILFIKLCALPNHGIPGPLGVFILSVMVCAILLVPMWTGALFCCL